MFQSWSYLGISLSKGTSFEAETSMISAARSSLAKSSGVKSLNPGLPDPALLVGISPLGSSDPGL